jgi:hypothetical protein
VQLAAADGEDPDAAPRSLEVLAIMTGQADAPA